jgi:8-oxo-dGTP pyrophosphatase MutT (NUDIX family)
MTPIPRRASRLVLVDPARRVLLLRDVEALTGRPFWITPGGGLNEGESHLEAARRELREETGLRDADIGPALWRGRRCFHARGDDYDQVETFFLVRVDPFEVDMSEVEDYERNLVHRWWTLEELDSTPELVLPQGLSALLRDALDPRGPGTRSLLELPS